MLKPKSIDSILPFTDKAAMGWTKRKDRTGKEYYSFLIYDSKTKKQIRLSKEDTLHIKSDEEADLFMRNKMAETEAASIRIKRKLEWQQKYFNYEEELLPLYEKNRRAEAPNSYKNQLYYMRQYVLPFFLGQKDCNNPLNWYLHFESFKEYLLTTKAAKGGKELAYNTRNHCVIAMNTFLDCIAKKNNLREEIKKCDLFPEHLMNKITFEDIYKESEIQNLIPALAEINSISRDFFILLARTGMRINEARGLSLNDLIKGEIPKESVNRMLSNFGIKTVVYIHLVSQPASRKHSELRDKNGSVLRKDLKGKRKKRDQDKGRYIPVSDDQLIQILKSRRELQADLLKKKIWTDKKSDYLLFDDINISTFESDLAKACEKCQIKYKSPHMLRHAFGTMLADTTFGNHSVAQLIMGHEDPSTTANYVHLAGQLREQTELKKQLSDDSWDDL